MKTLRLILLLGALGLGSCGRVADLKPAPGQSLPVRPMMARTTPTPEDLLTPPVYARPDRVDELIRRSQPREPDPFDLPPAIGGSAPAAPAGTDPQPVSDETGPVTPGA